MLLATKIMKSCHYRNGHRGYYAVWNKSKKHIIWSHLYVGSRKTKNG